MAAMSFQTWHLRPHSRPLWWNPNGVKVDNIRRSVRPSRRSCWELCVTAQVSSVLEPARGVENLEVLKGGIDVEQAEPAKAGSAAKNKKGYFNDHQNLWYKTMNEITTSGNAVPVLSKLLKAKKLTKTSLIGTLVRLKQLRAWKSIIQICEWLMLQDWWEFGFEDYCLLMVAYGKNGEAEKAETLLQSFTSAGHKSNIAMHTGLIEAFARKKMYVKAELSLKSLLESGPSPTLPTYHTLMKAYTEDDRLADAERIFSSMGEVKPDGRSYNLMIHAYGKAGKSDRAFELYQEMRKLKLDVSVVTFNTLIAGQKNIRDMESIFRQMKIAKVRPNVISYTALINAYGKAGRTEQAREFFDQMVSYGIRPTHPTYNVLLDAYAKARQVDEVERLLKQMRKDKCTPSVRAFTTLVHAYSLVGKMEKAEEILVRMKSENVEPNVFTFCATMAGYASVKNTGKMMKKFNDMKTLGLKPNQPVYTVMIKAWGVQDDFEASKFWFKEMVLSGCVADERCVSALMSASKSPDQFQEALALVESCR